MKWYLEVLKKYAQFTGRARRQEYWFFLLIHSVICMVLVGLLMAYLLVSGRNQDPGNAGFVALYSIGSGIFALYSLAVLIPGLAVMIRRLHDTNRSGWWWFISFVPFVGFIVLLVFLLQDSTPGPNQYGPNPKGFDGYAPAPGFPAIQR